MNDEKALERELLKYGLMAKKTEALEGVKLDAGCLTKFVKGKFRPFPDRLAEADAYAEALDAALLAEGAAFYLKPEADERKAALRRQVIWEIWENKYQEGAFADVNAGVAVTGVKNRKALEAAMSHTFGALVNGKTNGRPVTDAEKLDTWWRLFSGFMAEHKNAYLLEPLKRMGPLPEPERGEDLDDAA